MRGEVVRINGDLTCCMRDCAQLHPYAGLRPPPVPLPPLIFLFIYFHSSSSFRCFCFFPFSSSPTRAVVLFNHGEEAFEVKVGDRIAQLILEKICLAEIEEVTDELPDTKRGAGGFGSTGG